MEYCDGGDLNTAMKNKISLCEVIDHKGIKNRERHKLSI